MVENKTGVFCTRSCPFSSPSSSFTSKSLQSWTRNASRNASESGWKRSNRRSRKTPVRQREPRVAAVSGFPDTAGRAYPPETQNRTLRQRAAQKFDRSPAQRVRSKEEMQRNGRDLPLAAGRGIWSLCRRRSQHRIWLVAGVPAPCQMPQIGQKPVPTFTNRNMKKVCRCVWNVKTQIHRSIR